MFRGNCKLCGNSLSKITFSEKDFREMAKSVMDKVIVGSDIYHKTNPKELSKFMKFIEITKPYDVVIDGLNLTYIQKNSVENKSSLQTVIQFCFY